ncbi:MAG: hypothetical protein B7Y39_03775 [Bdellovibrio sp. 28-41-41]|nr:MAG: hypothetical protein B7Y39_03775 [Bdellovibrio sp. 28-41-41]
MKKVLLGAVNLIVAGSPFVAHAEMPVVENKQKVEAYNVASLKSIEGSWLNVANACKARGFNASPVELMVTSISSAAANVYAEFKA